MKRFLFTFIVCIASLPWVKAQKQIQFFTNTQEIDANRYEDVRGTPYLFKKWMKATIVDDKDSVYNNVMINYNAYEEQFEVQNEDNYIILDEKHYKSISIEGPDGNYLFKKGLHPKSKDKFFLVVHSGPELLCLLEYSMGLTENTIQNVGGPITFKKFKSDPIHHFRLNNSLVSLRLTKKKLTEMLGNKKALNAYIKKNKIDINSGPELSKLLDHYTKELLQ